MNTRSRVAAAGEEMGSAQDHLNHQERQSKFEPLMMQRPSSQGSGSDESTGKRKPKPKKPKPSGTTVTWGQAQQMNDPQQDFDAPQTLGERIQRIENSQKWQTSFVINIFTQALALWVSVPVTWYIIQAQLEYADAIRSISWVVSIYALGDGLGIYLAQKLYGNLSARQTLNLAIIGSVIASLIYALAGSITVDPETSSSIFRYLCTARAIQGLCHGTTYLTQQAYIGQVLLKEKNNELQLRMSRAFVLAIPVAVLLSFLASLCHFTIGYLDVTALSAPGLLLTIIFIMQLFLNFILFEEIPISYRRLPLNTTNSYAADNSQLTPYISNPAHHPSEEQIQSAQQNHPNRYITQMPAGVNIQQLLMSNYSDLHNQMLHSYHSGNNNQDMLSSLPPQLQRTQDPELQNDTMATRYLENRDLQQVAILTENEMRVLCQMPPNQTGILIAILIAYTLCSCLAVFETAFMPLITQADLIDHQIDTHFGYPLLTCISVTSAVSYYVFRRFIKQQERELPQLSDRSFLFIALILAILGSALLINYQAMGPQTTIGLTVLGMSLVIGVKSLVDMYAKMIGVSSLLGDSNQISIPSQEVANRKSVGWYLGLAVICIIFFRVVSPQFTSYLLLHGGASAIFWQTLSTNCFALLIFLCKFDAMQPHQSYLILKQREMISRGLDDKDLRLLDTIDHTIPSPFDGVGGLRSPSRNPVYNTYQSGLLFNPSMQDKDPNNSL